MIYTCINKQNFEQRLLSEREAFALDKRLWIVHPWNVTDGYDKPAISFPAPIIPPKTFTDQIEILPDNPIYKYIPVNSNGKKYLDVNYNATVWKNLADSKINGTDRPINNKIPLDKSFIKNGRKAKPKYHKKYSFQRDLEARSYKSFWTYRQYKVVSIEDDYLNLASIEQVYNLVGVKENKIHYYQIPMDEFGTIEFDINTELGIDRIMINLETCQELLGKTIVFNGVKNSIFIKDNTGKKHIYF